MGWFKWKAEDAEGNNLGEVRATSKAAAKAKFQSHLDHNQISMADTAQAWESNGKKIKLVNGELVYVDEEE